MEQLIITRADNSTYMLPGTDPRSKIVAAEQRRVLMGEDVVAMEVESVGYINFLIGDWIEVFGEKYTLNTLGEPERIGENLFKYNLTFEGVKYELTKVIYRSADWTGFNPTSEFPLTGAAEDFLTVMQYNLERAFGQGLWTIGTVPETEAKTLSFNSENCLAVLNRLCEEFETEYVITKSGNTYVINLQEAGSVLSMQLEYGRGKGLYSLSRSNVDSKNVITRLYAEGSDKNIKIGYRANATRLQLPGDPFLDSDNHSSYGIIEGSRIFDDIFPHRIGEVSSLGADEKTFVDSEMFDLNEKDTEGNTKWLIAGQSAKVHFNTGNLAGYEFEIASYDHSTHTFKIKSFEDERGLVFPNPDSAAFQIQAGDKYVILDIIMPDSYVTAAENELQTRAQEYLNQNKQPRVEYSLKIDRFYLKDTFEVDGTLPNILQTGDYIHVVDTKIGVDKNVRVKEFTRLVDDPYEYQVTLSDVIEPTRIERLISDSVEAKKALRQNKMFDPARTRRNWRDIVEVTAMLETLQAEIALIGSPAGQFQLTSFLEPNKGGDKNRFGATGGQLIHDSYDSPGTWNMSSFDVTLTESSAYYLYAKCSKVTPAGLFILSLTKIEVEEDPDYYHFPVGVLSSVNNDARTLTTTYGYTLISGNNISTGIIQNDASGIMINLETGEIRGAFTFTNGRLIEDVVNEKSARYFGGTDPSVAWTTIAEKRNHIDDVWAKTTDAGIEEYFWAETVTDNFQWVLNETIVGPGRIKTGAVSAEMIDVTGLFAKEINASNFHLGKGTVGDFEVDSVLKSENEFGQGIFIDPKERLIAIEDKAEGAGISAVRMRGGSLTPQAEIDGAASGTFETSVVSSPYDIFQNSNELRAGYLETIYFGKASSSTGIVKAYPNEPTGTERYDLVSGKNYAADFRFLFSIVHSGDSRNGKLHKLQGNLTVKVTSRLIGVMSEGTKVTLVPSQIQTLNIERSDQLQITNHPITRKTSFSNDNCVECFWEVEIFLNGDLSYQQWTSELFGHYWMTSESMGINFEVAVNKAHSLYPSLGVTELTTSGFQTIWAQNRYFRIDGEASGVDDIFIHSAGRWVHDGIFQLNGFEIVTIGNISSAIESDLSAYATKQYVQEGFISASDPNVAKLNQANVFQADVTFEGNIIQNGAAYETHAEKILTTNDFIVMRDGAVSGLGSGVSGLKVKRADGINDLVLGAGSDAIARVGWDGDSLQAIATREDSPLNGGHAYWDATTSMFKTRAKAFCSDDSDKLGGCSSGDYLRRNVNEVITSQFSFRSTLGSRGIYLQDYNGTKVGELSWNPSQFFIRNAADEKYFNIDWVGGKIGIGVSVPSEMLDIAGNIKAQQGKFSSDLIDTNWGGVDGFSGSGWKLDSTENHLMLDRLTVRGRMDVYEMVINQIRATNGSLWISDSMKVTTGYRFDEWDIENIQLNFDNEGGNLVCPFKLYDIVQAQKFDGRNIIKVVGRVWEVGTTFFRIKTNGYCEDVIDLSVLTGLEFVRIGNTSDSDRQGALYLTSSDADSPYIEVIDGVSDAKFTIPRNIRYIRDWSNGSTLNGGNYWVEIKAFDEDGNNLAAGKPVYDINGTKYTGSRVTDEVVSPSYLFGSQFGTHTYIIVDLEEIKAVEKVQIWHNYATTYIVHNSKTEVSADGVTWYTVFDSAIEGEYEETSAGKEHILGAKRTKLRIGKLSGISGQSGYGICGLKNGQEAFVISQDYARIAGVNFDNEKLYTDNWSLKKDGSFSFGGGKITGDPSGNMQIDGELVSNIIKSSNWDGANGLMIDLDNGLVHLGNTIVLDSYLNQVQVKDSGSETVGVKISNSDLAPASAGAGAFVISDIPKISPTPLNIGDYEFLIKSIERWVNSDGTLSSSSVNISNSLSVGTYYNLSFDVKLSRYKKLLRETTNVSKGGTSSFIPNSNGDYVGGKVTVYNGSEIIYSSNISFSNGTTLDVMKTINFGFNASSSSLIVKFEIFDRDHASYIEYVANEIIGYDKNEYSIGVYLNLGTGTLGRIELSSDSSLVELSSKGIQVLYNETKYLRCDNSSLGKIIDSKGDVEIMSSDGRQGIRITNAEIKKCVNGVWTDL